MIKHNNKKSRRILIAALLTALLSGMLLFLLTANAETPAFSLEDGVLTVNEMPVGSQASDYPWYPEREAIRKVVLKEGTGRLPTAAFEGYASLEEIVFPSGSISVGERSLANCSSLCRIYFTSPVTSIGRAAFLGSKNIAVIVLTDQTKHDFEVLAALSPYNLAVNGGVATGLDTAVYVIFSTFDPGWYDSSSELTVAGKLTAAADTNRDGTVSIRDATALLDRLSGPSLDWTGRLEDVDADGSTTITDLTALLNFLASPCVHRPERLARREATCAEAGYEAYCRCANCSAALTVKYELAKKDHTVQHIDAIAPGCTTEGRAEGRICSVCEAVLQEPSVLPPLGHLPRIIAAVPATCTSTGLSEGEVCGRCGVILVSQQVTRALDHTPQTLPAVPATCIASGSTEGSECSVCGMTLTPQYTVPSLGHSFTNGVCTRCGYAGDYEGRYEVIRFGSYEQDNDLMNGQEEIEWIVLCKEDGKALLLSRYALDCKRFQNDYMTYVEWEKSSIRSWLNNEFLSTAFNGEEQNRILPTTLVDDPTTADRVFLLSQSEACSEKYGFSGDRTAWDLSRCCRPTAYARANGCAPFGEERGIYREYCCWWLRTIAGYTLVTTAVWFVTEYGEAQGTDNARTMLAVRPAIWIEL